MGADDGAVEEAAEGLGSGDVVALGDPAQPAMTIARLRRCARATGRADIGTPLTGNG
jgi:hypothetical protein